MDEEKGLQVNTGPSNGANQPSRPGITSRGLSFNRLLERHRSPSPPTSGVPPGSVLQSPVSYRHSAKHDSQRPPLLRPTSVIPRIEPNLDFPPDDVVPWTDKLANYRRLVGIDSAPSHTLTAGFHRPGENIGIYQHTIQEEVQAKSRWKRYTILINTCLGLQLIVAATLVALGAGDGPKAAGESYYLLPRMSRLIRIIPVTFFGAINTVIAGILTFLKGSGLPNREKYFANEWSKLREFIEQREREFGREGCKLEVQEEVNRIEAMYNEVKGDVEANTPDAFTSVTQAKRIAQAGGGVTDVSGLVAALTGKKVPDQTTQGHNQPNPTTAPPPLGHNDGLGAGSGSGVGVGTGPAVVPTLAVPPQHADHGLLGKIFHHSGAEQQSSNLMDTVHRLQQKYGHGAIDKVNQLEKQLDHSASTLERERTNLERTVSGARDRLHHGAASAQSAVENRISSATTVAGREADRLSTLARQASQREADRISDAATQVGNRGVSTIEQAGNRSVSALDNRLSSAQSAAGRETERLTSAGTREAERVTSTAQAAGNRGQDQAEHGLHSAIAALEREADRIVQIGRGARDQGGDRVAREGDRVGSGARELDEAGRRAQDELARGREGHSGSSS